MMHGNALRYVGWQVRDRAGQRFLVCLVLLAAVIGAIVLAREK